jgi:hypothetical protein
VQIHRAATQPPPTLSSADASQPLKIIVVGDPDTGKAIYRLLLCAYLHIDVSLLAVR